MSNYELYEKVIEAYKAKEDLFNAAARNWIEEAENVKFEDEEANELFWKAKHLCAVWRSKAINSRVSKIRMIDTVRQIAEKNLPNPYPKVKVLGVNPEEVKIVDEPEAIKGVTIVEEKPSPTIKEIKEEIQTEHVLGVIPEEKKNLFGRHKKK